MYIESLNHLNTETFKHMKPFHESGLGELKQAWQGRVGLVKTWNRSMKHVTIQELKHWNA